MINRCKQTSCIRALSLLKAFVVGTDRAGPVLGSVMAFGMWMWLMPKWECSTLKADSVQLPAFRRAKRNQYLVWGDRFLRRSPALCNAAIFFTNHFPLRYILEWGVLQPLVCALGSYRPKIQIVITSRNLSRCSILKLFCKKRLTFY